MLLGQGPKMTSKDGMSMKQMFPNPKIHTQNSNQHSVLVQE